MIMLKDNHIDFAGGITKAISTTKDYLKNTNWTFKSWWKLVIWTKSKKF